MNVKSSSCETAKLAFNSAKPVWDKNQSFNEFLNAFELDYKTMLGLTILEARSTAAMHALRELQIDKTIKDDAQRLNNHAIQLQNLLIRNQEVGNYVDWKTVGRSDAAFQRETERTANLEIELPIVDLGKCNDFKDLVQLYLDFSRGLTAKGTVTKKVTKVASAVEQKNSYPKKNTTSKGQTQNNNSQDSSPSKGQGKGNKGAPKVPIEEQCGSKQHGTQHHSAHKRDIGKYKKDNNGAMPPIKNCYSCKKDHYIGSKANPIRCMTKMAADDPTFTPGKKENPTCMCRDFDKVKAKN